MAYQQPSSNLSTYFSFEPTPAEKEIPRLAVSCDGLDKRGKTHWAIMTTPDPVLVVTSDPGTMNIVNKARAAGRRVGVLPLDYAIPDKSVISKNDIDARQHAAWRKEWDRYEAAMMALLKEPAGPNRTRTIVKDTETDIKNLVELAYFGKARGNARQDLRTEMNGAYENLFWHVYKGRPDLNMCLIHKAKKQYVQNAKGENVWNGKYERDCHNKVGFQVDVSLTFEWDPVMMDLYTEIAKDQPFRYMDLNDSLVGKRWYAKDKDNPSAFWNLALEIFPDTIAEMEWWGQ